MKPAAPPHLWICPKDLSGVLHVETAPQIEGAGLRQVALSGIGPAWKTVLEGSKDGKEIHEGERSLLWLNKRLNGFKHGGVNTINKGHSGNISQFISSLVENPHVLIFSHQNTTCSPMVTPNYQRGQSCIADGLCTCKLARVWNEECWPWKMKEKINKG